MIEDSNAVQPKSAISGDNLLKGIVGMLRCILLLSWLLKRFRQPYFSAYIIAGILLAPQVLKLFTDVTTIAQIGSLGFIMQNFIHWCGN